MVWKNKTQLRGTPDQLAVAKILMDNKNDGKTKAVEAGYSWTMVSRVSKALSMGWQPDISQVEATLKKGTVIPAKPGASATADPLKAVLLKLIAQTHTIPNTPAIQQGFLCALKRGFPGDIAMYLSLVSEDFWYGRGIDLYREVSTWIGTPVPVEEIIDLGKEDQ